MKQQTTKRQTTSRQTGMSVIVLLGCLLCASAVPAWAQFGNIRIPGRAGKVAEQAKTLSEMEITTEQEVAMGREVAAKMIAYFKVFENKQAAAYVRKVGQAVALQSERQDVAYHFEILDTDAVNAFATPGGFIFVTRGLLESLKTEAELAGVLGHEVGHVAGKHIVREIQRGKAIKVGSDVAVEFTEGSQFLEDLAKQILTRLIDRGLSPKDEHDADRRGVDYAYAAGYRPDGLESFLETLQEVTARSKPKTSWLNRTHPKLKDRIKRVGKQIAKKKLEMDGRPDNFDRYQTTMKEAAAQLEAAGQ